MEVVAASSDLYLAILVDESSTNSFDRRDVHRQIENFLAGRMAPGVHVMLERFDGHLRTECPQTGASERDIQIWAACSDDEGNRAKPINRKSKARRLSAEESAPFGDAIQLGLPPGPYTWSVALKDILSGLTSYLVVRKVL